MNIMKHSIHSSYAALSLLFSRYIIPFESGIQLIKSISAYLFCHSVTETFHLVPCATSEVGNLNRRAAVFERKCGKRSE